MTKATYNGDARDLFEDLPVIGGVSEHVRGGFTTPEAFVRFVDETPKANRWHNAGFQDNSNSPDFFGNVTFKEARDLLLNGWHDGATRAAKIRDKINANNPMGPRLVRYDVAGPIVHVGRYLSGNPLHMKRIDAAKMRRRPVLTIVSHFGAMADIEANAMLNRAGVVAAVVDAIEAAGYSCHLIAYTASLGSNISAETAVTLKEAGQPVDIARVAFGLGHPAMLRRLTFAWRCSTAACKPLGGGMGSTKYEGLKLPEGSYMIPSIGLLGEGNFATEERAATQGLDVILRALKSQGCPAFAAEG